MAIRIDTGLMELLPDFYKPIKDYQQILTAEERELLGLAVFINRVHDNFFVQTMDEDTVYAWEILLGIPIIAGQTLEFRRERILNRITTKPPFTLNLLYKKLDELLGEGKWQVTMDYGADTLYIESEAKDQAYAIEIAYTINQIKPAHIYYVARPYIANDLLSGEVISIAGILHNYTLGSWQMGKGPFRETYGEEVKKVASIPSIQPRLLAGVASYVTGDVAKARVNGSLVISNITKSSTGAVSTITYDVLKSQVSNINKLELLDASDRVLSSSTVYIPVASDVEITHRITSKEG